jgi:O-antigen ligase
MAAYSSGIRGGGGFLPRARQGFSALEVIGTLALVCNLGLLLYAGLIPYSLFGLFVRWGTAAISLAFILCFVQDIWRPLAVFLPYILSGVLATPLGFDPVASCVRLAQLSFCIGAGVLIGYKFESETTLKYLHRSLLMCLVISAVVAVAFPSIGVEQYGSRDVWRGTFVQKNYLGWASALALILATTAVRDKFRIINLVLVAVSLACLVRSGSAGSLGGVVIAFAFYQLIRTLVRLGLDPVPFTLTLLLCAAVGGLFYYLFTDLVLGALGRDASFTGRDLAWRAYIREIGDDWLFGRGPGAFTSDNAITQALRDNNDFQGQLIKQPHSSYIGLVGDGGVPSLLSYLYCMLAIAFWYPAVFRSRLSMAAAAVAIVHLALGFTETRDIFTEGLGQFVLAVLWGAALREAGMRMAPAGPPGRSAARSSPTRGVAGAGR